MAESPFSPVIPAAHAALKASTSAQSAQQLPDTVRRLASLAESFASSDSPTILSCSLHRFLRTAASALRVSEKLVSFVVIVCVRFVLVMNLYYLCAGQLRRCDLNGDGLLVWLVAMAARARDLCFRGVNKTEFSWEILTQNENRYVNGTEARCGRKRDRRSALRSELI